MESLPLLSNFADGRTNHLLRSLNMQSSIESVDLKSLTLPQLLVLLTKLNRLQKNLGLQNKHYPHGCNPLLLKIVEIRLEINRRNGGAPVV